MLLRNLLRPYLYYECPGWGRIGTMCGILGAQSDAAWASAPVVTCRGKLHGYLMRCDLRNWSQRTTWFLGRFYSLEIQQLLMQYLRADDRIVDIGANVGMISLLASHLVGSGGIVEAIEPNPDCRAEIQWLIQANQIGNIHLFPMGLGNEAGTHTLTLLDARHTGTGTLAPVSDLETVDNGKIHSVPVHPGDQILLNQNRSIAAIKIDVEGYEGRVIDGLTNTLQKWQPLIVVELISKHLNNAGDSIPAVVNRLTRLGYQGYWIHLEQKGFYHRLALTRLSASSSLCDGHTDAVWVHPANARSSEWIASLNQ